MSAGQMKATQIARRPACERSTPISNPRFSNKRRIRQMYEQGDDGQSTAGLWWDSSENAIPSLPELEPQAQFCRFGAVSAVLHEVRLYDAGS